MEISVLIAAIGALCGVVGYLYRENTKLNNVTREDLAKANATIESLRAEIRTLRNDDSD